MMSSLKEEAKVRTKIAVVEDERVVAFHLKQQLLRLGYDVSFVAASAQQFFERLTDKDPDIILMDIHLEGEADGIEVATRLTRERGLPVIYLTAYSEETTIDRARTTKPYGYLLKPFSERELHATIQMALERREVERTLVLSHEHINLALDVAEMAAFEVDLNDRLFHFRGGHKILTACLNGQSLCSIETILDHVAEGDRSRIEMAFRNLQERDHTARIEFRLNTHDSKTEWLQAIGRKKPSPANDCDHVIGVIQDISDRKAEVERQHRAEVVFDTTLEGLLILDSKMRVTMANPGYQSLTGFAEAELVGTRPTIYEAIAADGSLLERFQAAISSQSQWRGEVFSRHKSGQVLSILVNVVAIANHLGEIESYVVACSDLTAIRKAEENLRHLAHYDSLTELPNRLLAKDRLEHAIGRCQRDHDKLALFFVDLDYFKRINDTLGHSVGDEVLKVVADRMKSQVRGMDTVARISGDEFMVILERLDDINHAALVARKVINAICQPIIVDEHRLIVGASVGISIYPDDAQNRESLAQAADTAMYVAKEKGRNGYSFYTTEMTERVTRANALENDLRNGLLQGELRLYYQPQLSLISGLVTGVECLIRWQHPSRGMLGAGEIVPTAEKSGLIIELGTWVLNEACRQMQVWLDQGLPEFSVAVNASAQQMRNGRLFGDVTTALLETRLPARFLEVEITESMLQDDPDTVQTLNKLKELGVTLAIDDFGTGYSCLASLKNLPIQRLKIDRAFVEGVPDDHNEAMITETVIAMAHRLNMNVIAEGVETPRQLEFLRARGCDDVQGYLFAKPLPAEQIPAFILAFQKALT